VTEQCQGRRFDEEETMRPDHVQTLRNVAQQCTCWIGVREPNALAERWIGNTAGVPKPLTCKAKTADNPTFMQAGLVVDPTARPEAFAPASLPDALEKWMKFSIGSTLPPGYAAVSQGPERGLVKLNGRVLYSDYDLMGLLRSDANGTKLFTTQVEQAQLFARVQPALNRAFGVELIQHGTELSWDGGVGAREFEFVLWFGPGGRTERHPSSMPPVDRAH
jgi:hypothetical protein